MGGGVLNKKKNPVNQLGVSNLRPSNLEGPRLFSCQGIADATFFCDLQLYYAIIFAGKC